ncbi:hypothetical protein L0244_18555, partial [bacterium]|nr:hypothetical protein [bacterium]
ILPENGALKAGAQDIFASDEWQGDEPPSFRPTIHFALGELVQEHSDSWEENPYAVVSPLKNLEGQLVNVFPHDTFVLGDLSLQEGMIVLVPKGTDISKIPQGIEVKEYDPKVGLRRTVDSTISEKQGWHVQMKPEGVAIGSVAHIEDAEINDSKFFQSLFEKYPHISFGTHVDSERGDAFRFGVIEQTIEQVMKNYSDHWSRFSTVEVSFQRSLIVHNLQRLEQTIENSSINPQALQAFEEKKGKLLGWLNIIDCDLETRQRLGRTFTGASESVQKMVRARRNDPAKLREFVDERYVELPDAIQESEMSPTVLAEMLSGMSAQELEQFKAGNEAVFAHTSLPEFYSHYAVKRWIVVKDEQAQSEGLDQLLANSLEQLPAKSKERDGVFGNLKEFLNEDSNRLETALTILRSPAVKAHLAETCGVNFSESGPMNLREVIAAHPETRVLFESQELSLPDEQKEAYQLLDAIGQIDKPRIDLQEALKNFRKANSLASDMEWSKDILRQELETISKPMNTARNLDDMLGGTTMTLYEVLRTYEKPLEVWRKVGLEKEYRKVFKTDSLFWSSDKSLIEIYRMLKAESA